MSQKTKAADAPPPADQGAPAKTGRATAAEVSQACNDCATACTECADATANGTADEAIASTQACMAACESCMKVCESFLGMGGSPEPKEPEPPTQDAPKPTATVEMAARVAKLEAHIAGLESEKAFAAVQARIPESLHSFAKELSATSPALFDSFVAKLPEGPAPKVLGVKAVAKATAGEAHGLTDRELKICKETGCAPEAFAALKAQREAAQKG